MSIATNVIQLHFQPVFSKRELHVR